MKEEVIRVVVIEDDPMVQEINTQFIERVAGYQVVGVAGNGAEGVRLVGELSPDLVVMDVFMPVQDGLKALAELRVNNEAVDVIVITAAKDKPTIQAMLRNGAVDYIIKPFQFERIRQSLESYRQYRLQLGQGGFASQEEVDRLLFRKTSEPAGRAGDAARETEALPKGLHAVTLDQIARQLAEESQSLSAEEVAERVGIARVTARRYLDYLVKVGQVRLDVSYGGIGRPTNRYMQVHK